MSTVTMSEQKPKEEGVCHLNDDSYWEVIDDDNGFDGTLHVVSTYDGSMIKIGLKEIIKSIPRKFITKTLEEITK